MDTVIVVDGDGLRSDPGRPLLHADDLGVLHGDGVFETMLVRDGRARLVRRHLARLVDGAARLDLPEPDVERIARAVETAQDAWSGTGDGALRIVYTRGRESDPGSPTWFVTVSPVPERAAIARRDGVTVLLLTRAQDPDAVAPWELAGAKALSYARNTAALRHARAQGFDDAIYLSSTGTVLESPRANVVALFDGVLTATPAADGILAGTTQEALYAAADRAGVPTREARMTPEDLRGADGVWLLSSLTLAARVRRMGDFVLAETPNRAGLVPKLVTEAITRP
ncbi:aminodeoxychorismate lyase [Gordonia humi]